MNRSDDDTTRMPNPAATAWRSWRAGPASQQGKWGYVLAWALGVPIPILILVYLLRGCT
jgi:hypothetical protein